MLDPPQACVLIPLLFSLFTNSCIPSHQSVKLLKFVDDTTLIGLIWGWVCLHVGDDHLVTWCSQNNLELYTLKTVEMVVDFRKNTAHTGLTLVSPSSPPPSPSGTLLPLLRTRADCSLSCALLRRWLAAMFHPFSLPSGRRLQSIRTKTTRDMNSFFPSAVGILNPLTLALLYSHTHHHLWIFALQ